jgi:toxin ParE1/3/4
MKKLPYVLSKKAVLDLEEIWHYTLEKWSLAQADRCYELIFDEIDYICQYPTSGIDMDDIRKGYRVSKVKSHQIYYRINNSLVEIIRILHEKMDIDSRLSD